MRVSRFKIDGKFGDKSVATIEIRENSEGEFDFVVRPKHSREEFTAPLQKLAELVFVGAIPGSLPSSDKAEDTKKPWYNE